jgi:hypothetical protein
MFVPVPPRRLCVGAGALSPEKGGALRKQSTQGRRLGVAAVLCGALFVVPLLLLQNESAHAHSVSTAASAVRSHAHDVPLPGEAVNLPSHLVAYHDRLAGTSATTTSTTAAPVATTTTAPTPAPTTTTTPAVVAEVIAPTTTTTTAPPVSTNSESGQATWYSEAPPGYCASPTLPFGTVLTVTNVATGASTTCTVDDREAAGYPRVVDMSPSGFEQIADLSQGVVDVTISW